MRRHILLGAVILLTSSLASAQPLLAPGAAQYPSPGFGARHFLDGPVAACVVATPCPYGQECVILKPCPPGTLVPPQPTQLPAPTPPPQMGALPAPPPERPEPKESPPPVTINIYPGTGTVPPEVKLAPPKAPAKPAPKAAPKEGKPCPC